MKASATDPDAAAKRYVDLIIALNRKHGAKEDVSSDEYRDAIEQAAGLFDPAVRRRAWDVVTH